MPLAPWERRASSRSYPGPTASTFAFVQPSAKNKAFMSRYEHDAALEIVWGDLCCYDDILRCVTGADYVLHVGAFVSPEADKLPQRSLEVNLGSTMNIIRAIKAQPRQPVHSASG